MQSTRTCNICGEVEGRDATPDEIRFLLAPPGWVKEYKEGKWTGKWLCSRCNTRIMARRRRAETAPIPSNIEECRAKHNIILRIVKGLPACIEKGNSQVIHHGIGCSGCPMQSKALLELGNGYLKINSRARKLQREFEKLLLEHCGLEHMPDDCSDIYVDLDCYGAGSMTEKELDKIIMQIKRAAEREL